MCGAHRILPLSKQFLDDAIALIDTVFPWKLDQKTARRSFRDSLTQPESRQQYWLAVDPHGEIAGVTGLYYYHRSKHVVWLGWFGVHPQHRHHGLGSRLLDFSIAEAIKRGFSILKVYTSFHANERAAHDLYRKYGFVEIAKDKREDEIVFQKSLCMKGPKV